MTLTVVRRVSMRFTIILLSCLGRLAAQNATIAGAVHFPFPTVVNLAIEWFIEGDDNLNGTVSVDFRKAGAMDWRQAMDLRRVPAGTNVGFSWDNKHSGSIFDLEPGTSYDIRLRLTDPDGGSEERLGSATTRAVPRITTDAEIVEIAAGTYGVLNPENGTEQRPRVYRSSGGEVIFDYINMQNRSWVYLEGLTIISSGANSSRAIRMDGATDCVVRRCTIRGLNGITAYATGITRCYIADNTITGTCEWTEPAMGASGDNDGEGIQFTGPGNVIAYNVVTGFRDCISTMEDDGVSQQLCNDIYGNDVYVGVDDGIEADFCFHNCRVMRNRITNCYVGLSSQPSLGGPTWFIRNVMYNVIHAAFKLKRDSRGDVVLHNTVVKIGTGLGGNSAMDFAYFRNNLAFGGPDGGVNWGEYGAGNPYAADIIDPDIHSSFDYDAVGAYEVAYVARIGGVAFSDVETNGIERLVLSETFDRVAFPNPPVPQRLPPDLRPLPGSAVVDRAQRLPNVNDNWSGEGPDIGAYEAGATVTQYGPRSAGVDEGSLPVARRAQGVHRTVSPLLSIRRYGSGNGIRLICAAEVRSVRIVDAVGQACAAPRDFGHGSYGWSREDMPTAGTYVAILKLQRGAYRTKFIVP